MRIALLNLFLLFFIVCKGQNKDQRYEEKILMLCPKAEIIEVETKEDYVEIEYLCEGEKIETGLTFDLQILYSESEAVINDETLSRIRKKLDKKYFGWSIDEASLIEMADTSFYKVEVVHEQGIEDNVYFTLDGKFYKSGNIPFNEVWNLDMLEAHPFYNRFGYRLTRPDQTYEMPDILVEISGIALLNESELFCVQDEEGIVFRYDLQEEEVSQMYRFTDVGDFEDITINGDEVYILRSDGTIFSFNYRNFSGDFHSRTVPLNCPDIEGLFFYGAEKRYLIACKDKPINENNSVRHIYGMDDVHSGTLELEFVINLNEINSFIKSHYPEFGSTVMQFNPSAVAVHPVTGEVFVLSADNRLLTIYENKKLKSVYPLAEELFYKPEGLGFAVNGDLYISSEGIKNGFLKGQIHYFKWHPNE